MSDQYDAIAEQYKRSKQAVWRHHIEQYSFFNLLGEVAGLSILDLACGEGHYTRMIKALGAARVVGVDISPKMIELAEQAERRHRQGIEYRVSDARDLALAEPFDIVLAAYLLNYASSEEDLFAMCQAIHRNLKPGGRFVTVNNNPGQSFSRFGCTEKYGFVKSADEEPCDGTPVYYTFFMEGETFRIQNYHLDVATHHRALARAGFSGVEWRKMELAPSEASGPGREFWDEFFLDPPVILLHCRKPEGGA